MITGLSGMGLSDLVGAMARTKVGQPPSRSVQPMPKMDTIQFSVKGRELAAAVGPERQAFVAQQPALAERPAGTVAGAAADEMSMMDRMKASFFTRQGDDGFDATVDLNSDGRIDNADLAALRADGSAPEPVSMLQQMQQSFLTRAGDERFDPGLDMNTDGIINFADLAMLRAKLETGVTRPPVAPAPVIPSIPDVPEPVIELSPATTTRVDPQDNNAQTIDSIRSAFFSQAGDEAFNAAADINGDGRINFADLAGLTSE